MKESPAPYTRKKCKFTKPWFRISASSLPLCRQEWSFGRGCATLDCDWRTWPHSRPWSVWPIHTLCPVLACKQSYSLPVCSHATWSWDELPFRSRIVCRTMDKCDCFPLAWGRAVPRWPVWALFLKQDKQVKFEHFPENIHLPRYLRAKFSAACNDWEVHSKVLTKRPQFLNSASPTLLISSGDNRLVAPGI